MTSSRFATRIAMGLALAAPWPGAQAQAMTEKELCQLYLDVVEDAVAVFEPLWVDDSERVPNSGFYDFRKYDTWGPKWYAEVVTVPGAGQIVYCYSVLLSETQKETFTDKKIPRATLIDHAIKAIRWCCLTSAYVKNPYPFLPARDEHSFYEGKQWRRKLGYRADELGWLTVGAARLWHLLDDETKGLVEQVMIGGAQPKRLVRTWTLGGGGNHDVVKQDLASTIGAAYLFPKREDHGKYQDIIRDNGIDLVATVHDKACKIQADGKPIHEWSAGAWNLYQDYSSDHHGWCQVWYGGDLIFEGRTYIELLSHIRKMPVPEVYTYEGNGYDGVLAWLKTICLPEGEPASVHGMEYDAYYGAGLLGYCYGAVIKKDPVAAALEEQAAGLLRRHTRAVRLYDYHRNCYAKAATCYLLHKIRGPRAEPLSPPDAWRARNGGYHYRWQQCLVHRSSNKWASWSWGTISGRSWGRMGGFVVPARGGTGGPEPLVYLLQNSLIGQKRIKWEGKAPTSFAPDVVYRHSCSDDGLATVGTVTEPGIDRHYAFYSFDGGPCVLFTVFRARRPCRMGFTGIPVYFYVRPGLTKSRQYYDAQGAQPLERAATRSSAWWSVNDRLGVATVGGSGKVKIERVVGKNWARTNAYKDKADAVFSGPMADRKVGAGEHGVDMAAVITPETGHEKVARVCEDLQRGILELPKGWKGVIVRDADRPGKRYLAVANLYGDDQAAVSLSFERGAPVLSGETVIRGKTAAGTLHLAPLESLAETVEVYAEVLEGKAVRARRLSRTRYLFTPIGTEPVKVRVRFAGGSWQQFRVSPETHRREGTGPIGQLGDSSSVTYNLTRPILAEIRPLDFVDNVAPAVEITDIVVRENGQVQVAVSARDRSGVGSVELYCDGKRVVRPPAGSYVWVHRPGNGAHTFHAVATDGSPQRNKRTSFKRTVVVEINKTRP